MLNGANVDLAFIDVHMPELSGTEAFWSARKQGIKTFVTLMSTPPAAEAVDVAIKLRAYEFLFKPFGVADALAIMKTYDRISSPTKVLVVDDSSAVRQIVQKIVARQRLQLRDHRGGRRREGAGAVPAWRSSTPCFSTATCRA